LAVAKWTGAMDNGGPGAFVIETPGGDALGLALVIHGRNGAPSQPHIAAIRAAYARRGWATVTPPLRCSSANPGLGDPSAFTMAGHLADAGEAARRALDGARRLNMPDRLALAGHSMGGWAVAELGAAMAVDHVLGVSPVISGAALIAARERMGPDAVAALRREVPGAHAEWPHQDARRALGRIDAPVGVIVGDADTLTPPEDARRWLACARDARFLSVLPGQHHCPEGPAYAQALDAALAALAG
jgi:pimeloyl-ACP methyl ester carboxylesterase